MKRFHLLNVLFLYFMLSGCCFDRHTWEGSKVKKYGVVASLTDVTYYSPKRIAKTPDLSKDVPKGGILEFDFNFGRSDSSRYKSISYEVKSLDGKLIQTGKCKRHKLLASGEVSSGSGNPAGRNLSFRFIMKDTIHVEKEINGSFEVFVMDAKAGTLVKKQRYKIIPDVR